MTSTDQRPFAERQGTDPVLAANLSHGSTVASWTMFGIMFVGVVLGCIAFTIPNWPLFIIGGVIVVVGLIVGIVLRAAGWGVGGKHTREH